MTDNSVLADLIDIILLSVVRNRKLLNDCNISPRNLQAGILVSSQNISLREMRKIL